MFAFMEPFNFNELPEVIRLLFEKVELIEAIVKTLKPSEKGENDLLDVSEAAAFLKITIAALYTKVSRKEIPYSKPGKRLYFNRGDLQDWVNEGKHKTAIGVRSDLNSSLNRFKKRAQL